MDSENDTENKEQSQNLSLANTAIKGSFSLMKENKDSNIKELSQNLNNMNCSGGQGDILGTKLFKFKKTNNNKKQFGENIAIEPIN